MKGLYRSIRAELQMGKRRRNRSDRGDVEKRCKEEEGTENGVLSDEGSRGEITAKSNIFYCGHDDF